MRVLGVLACCTDTADRWLRVLVSKFPLQVVGSFPPPCLCTCFIIKEPFSTSGLRWLQGFLNTLPGI